MKKIYRKIIQLQANKTNKIISKVEQPQGEVRTQEWFLKMKPFNITPKKAVSIISNMSIAKKALVLRAVVEGERYPGGSCDTELWGNFFSIKNQLMAAVNKDFYLEVKINHMYFSYHTSSAEWISNKALSFFHKQ